MILIFLYHHKNFFKLWEFQQKSSIMVGGGVWKIGKKEDIMKIYQENQIREDYARLTKRLIENKITITTMESATSGQIASLITDTEGSSAILKGAFITYSNEAKILQGVPAQVIDQYTVYSRETAKAMAKAAAKAYHADLSIGVTGTMGNRDPENPLCSQPGQVYFAIEFNGECKDYFVELDPQPTRLAYKLAVAKEVYDRIMEEMDQRGLL
jgi:PncC family amidohydrolase